MQVIFRNIALYLFVTLFFINAGFSQSRNDLTFLLVGDIMLGTSTPVGHLPNNNEIIVDLKLREILTRGNTVNIGNLEGTFCNSGESDKCADSENCFAFRMPEYLADSLANLNFSLLSLANNHANDFGDTCRSNTEKLLDSLGIAWSGKVGSIAYLKQASVAMIAFHYGDKANSLFDQAALKKLIDKAHQSASTIIVSFHGGAEGEFFSHTSDTTEYFLGENRGAVREFAHCAIDAGADIVFGHGPHVLRGIELYQGKLIAYSLGNFATYSRFNLTGNLGISTILEATIDTSGNFVSGMIHPVKQLGQGYPVFDEKNQAISLIQKMTQEDFKGGSLLIENDGHIWPKQ
mgnify:CR=1 FL=1|jgi:poly-gamma-glutamate capsule biosynthesis protein CapA/YwtB (metallophosphatase superfamily)